MAGKSEGRKAGRGARRGEHRDDVSDYKQKRRAEKQAAGSKKGGCVPKLFMLILPFAALGTYLVLRS